MFMTLATYILAGVHLLLPPYLVFRLWRSRFRTVGAWAAEAAFILVVLITLLVIGRWDVVGVPIGYAISGGSLVGVLPSAWRVANRPLSRQNGIRWRWGALLEGLVFAGLLVWGLVGMSPDVPSVEMAPPLRGEDYYVVQGGGTPPINYHGAAAPSQSYALDVNQLNGWGMRGAGFYPSVPENYAVYGDTIYSPIAGTVVRTADTLEDHHPPEKEPEHPAGNHVWIRADSLYVLLAHMKQGSVRVRAGQQIGAGAPLGRVGNSGNTTEPHLHLHAVTFPSGAPPADSLGGGCPVPIRIDGRFLVRNNRLDVE